MFILFAFPLAMLGAGRLLFRSCYRGVNRAMTRFAASGLFFTGLVALAPVLFVPAMVALGLALVGLLLYERGEERKPSDEQSS